MSQDPFSFFLLPSSATLLDAAAQDAAVQAAAAQDATTRARGQDRFPAFIAAPRALVEAGHALQHPVSSHD